MVQGRYEAGKWGTRQVKGVQGLTRQVKWMQGRYKAGKWGKRWV